MRAAAVLKVLSDKTRVKIVQCLLSGKCCVGGLHKKVGTTQPNISQHISVLKKAGIVRTAKKGKQCSCEIRNPDALRELLNAANRV